MKGLKMDKFEKHVQTQSSKLRRHHIKFGKLRTPRMTAKKKSASQAGMNERMLKFETENKI